MSWIVGCDTGGTFTDLVALSDAGEFRVAKVPSTPPDFDRAVIEGVRQLGIPSGDIRRLFHGTTVTTNAVITKRGAATGLVTTEGFRDILEIRRANREELYDILWDPPPALVPRRHRLEVAERVAYDGEVVTPLDEDTVRDAIRRIRARGLESVAVCLINAHMNPAHERRVRDILLEADPELSVSLSTEILPGAAGVRADRDDRRQRLHRADPQPLHDDARGEPARGRLRRATSSSSCTTAAAR